MKRARSLGALAGIVVAVLAVTAIGGCGAGGPKSSGPSQTTPGNVTGESKTVKVGEEFKVELESNPTTGFDWQMTTRPDETILGLTGDEFVSSNTSAVGAPGVRTWRFKALKAGNTNMVFQYMRSWEKDVPPAKTHSLSVTVE
jgi:predicted secreted protein